ncbi:MAG: P63C domain-containing protein [Actinobacteria bacterium]|jgi:P63C domain.|nr:P63C domain-containing protein [Actinomycetota bacterium]
MGEMTRRGSQADTATELARKGGRARAAKLSPEERRVIASEAAAARWGDVHVAESTGEIRIGDLSITCAVLDDGTRVVSQSAVLQALGRNPEKSRRTRGSSEVRAPFLLANNLQPFISERLRELDEPIAYRVAGEAGRALGYRAEMLPLVCLVYIDAKAAGALDNKQVGAAAAAEVLYRGLATVGIVALVDEATGFQERRARDELRVILEGYVSAEFRRWVRVFPDEFFEQVYRLQGWDYEKGSNKRPGYVGTLINRYIYDALPVGVTEELQRVNPKNERGNRARRHHQHLTADTGNVHLDRQISTVMTLMRISTSNSEFEDLFARAFAPQLRLPLVIDPVSYSDSPKN